LVELNAPAVAERIRIFSVTVL